MEDTPDYIWNSLNPQAKTVNLLLDWIKANNEKEYNNILELWYKELGKQKQAVKNPC